MRVLSFVLLLVCVIITDVSHAQWSRVAVGLLGSTNTMPGGTHQGSGGAMTYRDGILWAGFSDLWKSTDQGLTWSRATSPSGSHFFRDLNFLDQNTGLALVDSQGVYVTSDQAQTWRRLLPLTLPFSGVFDGSANDVIVSGDNKVYSTHDGGATWRTFDPNDYPGSVVSAGPGVTYLTSGYNKTGVAYLHFTTDYGATWQHTSQAIGMDSYSFAIDSCDKEKIYIVNEAYWGVSFDHTSKLYRTNDGGLSWDTTLSHPLFYLSGSLALSKHAIYVSTLHDGVLRSTDHARSWTRIQGPNSTPDTRLISAITDNIIVAIDSSGSVWRTLNSGGDSVTVPAASSYSLASPHFDTISACDTASRATLRLRTPFCAAAHVLSQKVLGTDSSAFAIVTPLPEKPVDLDSLVLSFSPSRAGPHHANFALTLDDGSTLSVRFTGIGIPARRTLNLLDTAIFDRDTASLCDAPITEGIRIHSSSCEAMRLVSVAIGGEWPGYYALAAKAPGLLHGTDTVKIRFLGGSASQGSAGMYPATITLRFDDSTTLVVRLNGHGASPNVLRYDSVASPFAGDTIRLCSTPITRSLAIADSSCEADSVLSQMITGSDSTFFEIARPLPSTIGGLSRSDSATITLSAAPDAATITTTLHAKYVALLKSGRTISIPLTASLAPALRVVRAQSSRLFADTVSLCEQYAAGLCILHDTSCIPWRMLSAKWVGVDSTHFRIEGLGGAEPGDSVLRGEDTVALSFTAQGLADDTVCSSTLVLQLEDTTVSIPVTLYVRAVHHAVSIGPSMLFADDTISACDAPAVAVLTMFDSACQPLTIEAARITGADSMAYAIESISHGTSDTVRVLFAPDAPRAYTGSLQLQLSDGTVRNVPLGGYSPRSTVALASMELENDTIGASIRIPIRIRTTTSLPPMDARLAFDSTLVNYKGSYTNDGRSMDDRVNGVVVLHLPMLAAGADTVLGYVSLDLFPTPDTCVTMSIDSVTQAGNIACSIEISSGIIARICTHGTCATPILTRFLRWNAVPGFAVAPNPTTGIVALHRRGTPISGDVRISVVDDLGTERMEQEASSGDLRVDLSKLPEGLYFIRITGNGFTESLPVIRIAE